MVKGGENPFFFGHGEIIFERNCAEKLDSELFLDPTSIKIFCSSYGRPFKAFVNVYAIFTYFFTILIRFWLISGIYLLNKAYKRVAQRGGGGVSPNLILTSCELCFLP
jgi:hypothetical protein